MTQRQFAAVLVRFAGLVLLALGHWERRSGWAAGKSGDH